MKCCKNRQKPGNFPSMPNVKRSDAKTCQKHPKAPCRPTKLPSCGPSIYGHIGFREAFPWWWNEERGVAATARTGSQRNNRFQIGKLWSTHSLDMNCVSDSQAWQHQVRVAWKKKWQKKNVPSSANTIYHALFIMNLLAPQGMEKTQKHHVHVVQCDQCAC